MRSGLIIKPGLEIPEAELAERLKVSRQTVNAIETERYEPSLSLAFTIAKLFERPIEEIFRPGRR